MVFPPREWPTKWIGFEEDQALKEPFRTSARRRMAEPLRVILAVLHSPAF